MPGKNLSLLAGCFALLIAAVCAASQGTDSATNAVANTDTRPLALPADTPLPRKSPETVRVRLMEVETNADVVDWPSPDKEIIIRAGEIVLDKKTDDDGVVVFDAVPCGRQIVITRKGEYGGEDGVFHRSVPFAGRQVDLEIIEQVFGGKFTLRQRKPQRM